MKILYLTNVQIPGGFSAQAMQISRMARAFDLILGENFLLVSPKNKKNKNLKTDFKWKKIFIPILNSRLSKQLYFLIYSFFIVKKFQPDFIYTRDVAVAYFFKIFGYKTVYEIHKPFETKIGDFLFKKIARKIKIVAISLALKNFVIEKYCLFNVAPAKSLLRQGGAGVQSDLRKKEDSCLAMAGPVSRGNGEEIRNNILVAHDGVFLEEFEKIKESKEELRKKYLNLQPKQENNFIVLYQGSLQEGKGADLILEAAKKLKMVRFVWIGNHDGPGFEKLNIKSYSNILLLGEKLQEEVPAYLKAADLLLIPFTKKLKTWKYHSALKMFEYMASKIPILASNIGSTKEILNENNSLLFDPENKGDLEEKIIFAKNNYSEIKKKAEKAFLDVKNYTWTKRAEKIINFLKE